MVAAATILMADLGHAPVSTTHVLSSGVAGTMTANGSGVQGDTVRKILLAWALTLPGTVLMAGVLYAAGRLLVGGGAECRNEGGAGSGCTARSHPSRLGLAWARPGLLHAPVSPQPHSSFST